MKILSDLLTRMGFWCDDSQVWELVVTRKEGRPERTEVTIAPFRDIAPGWKLVQFWRGFGVGFAGNGPKTRYKAPAFPGQ